MGRGGNTETNDLEHLTFFFIDEFNNSDLQENWYKTKEHYFLAPIIYVSEFLAKEGSVSTDMTHYYYNTHTIQNTISNRMKTAQESYMKCYTVNVLSECKSVSCIHVHVKVFLLKIPETKKSRKHIDAHRLSLQKWVGAL